ncbi:hypothetical protein G6F37_010759 [Rhizopus arrhizus]|nr:hypothetical protein G6F38_010683 [Rhizopus arrhizus]KAG1152707.1 hypothetical protein G6F37_010759 [Rhizopus arrhizus]
MQIFNYLAFAFFSVFTVFAQDGSVGNGTTSNATIFELLSSNTSTYNSSRFISLLNSDSGYQPIIQLLSEPTSNLTAFIPNDAVLNRVFNDFREYNQDQGINSTSEYPPANWTYHNMSVLDLLQYHVVNESFLLTNLTTSNVSVVHSMLNNSAVNHFVNSSLPILIQANTTYENATNQTWLDINAKYLKFNVGNGVNSSTVLLKDLNATNGHFNIINSVLIPPLEPSIVIPYVRNASYLPRLLRNYPFLNTTLNNGTNFTVFAPINRAVDRLDTNSLDNGTFDQLLYSHIVYGVYFSTNFTQNATNNIGQFNLTTYNNNGTLPVSVNGSLIQLNGTAKVVRSNIFFNNGVMHLIDRVLNVTSNSTAQ